MAANFSTDDIICGKNTCNIHRVAILKCPSVGLQIRCWLCDVGKLRGADLITVKSLASKNAFRLVESSQLSVEIHWFLQVLCSKLSCVRSKGPTENNRV